MPSSCRRSLMLVSSIVGFLFMWPIAPWSNFTLMSPSTSSNAVTSGQSQIKGGSPPRALASHSSSLTKLLGPPRVLLDHPCLQTHQLPATICQHRQDPHEQHQDAVALHFPCFSVAQLLIAKPLFSSSSDRIRARLKVPAVGVLPSAAKPARYPKVSSRISTARS